MKPASVALAVARGDEHGVRASDGRCRGDNCGDRLRPWWANCQKVISEREFESQHLQRGEGGFIDQTKRGYGFHGKMVPNLIYNHGYVILKMFREGDKK